MILKSTAIFNISSSKYLWLVFSKTKSEPAQLVSRSKHTTCYNERFNTTGQNSLQISAEMLSTDNKTDTETLIFGDMETS